MISISSTLQAAQQSPVRTPSVSFEGSDLLAGVPRLSFTRWYTGLEADTPHAACMTMDGSLVRLRNDSGTLRVQRVASPTSGSTYSSWTSLGTAIVSGTGVAVAAEEGGDRLVMVYVKTGGLRLSYRFSSDDGQTWGSASDVQGSNESGAIGWCAVTWVGNGWRVYYDVGGSVLTRSESANPSGNWGGSTTITPPNADDIRGIAAWYFSGAGEVGLLVSVLETGAADMTMLAYNAGTGNTTSNTWRELVRADGAGFFGPVNSPTLNGHGDTPLGGWCERETADVTYLRTFLARGEPETAGDGWYSEPQPILGTGFVNGVVLAHYPGETRWYACHPYGVWAADADHSTEEYGHRVVRADLNIGLYQQRARVILDNADGLLSPALGLRPGASVRLRLGYVTSAGSEYGTEQRFSVAAVREFLTRRGERRVELHCDGPWERLADRRASRAVQQPGAAGSRHKFFAAAFARAGGVRVVADATHPPSTDWTTDHQPALLVRPSESWRSVAERLLEAEAEHVVVDADEARVRSLSASDVADLAVSDTGAGHRLVTLERVTSLTPWNWARVSSESRYVDRVVTDALDDEGPRMRATSEADGDSNTKVTEYGDARLARARWTQEAGHAVIPWHAGLELLDVVEVTDTRIDVAAEDLRIIAIRGTLDRDAGTYEAALTLSHR